MPPEFRALGAMSALHRIQTMMTSRRSGTILIAVLTLGVAVAAGQATAVPPPQPAGAPLNDHLDVRKVPIPDAPPAPNSEVLDTKGMKGDLDHSALESPVAGSEQGKKDPRPVFATDTVSVTMSEALRSGVQRNGETIHATLANALKLRNGSTLPVGTKVEGTIVSAAKAGIVSSGGVLTLQLTRIGDLGVVSSVVEIDGSPAEQDGAYGVPVKGSEARVDAGSRLEFHLMLGYGQSQ